MRVCHGAKGFEISEMSFALARREGLERASGVTGSLYLALTRVSNRALKVRAPAGRNTPRRRQIDSLSAWISLLAKGNADLCAVVILSFGRC